MASPTDQSRRIAAVVSSALSDAGISQRDAAARTGIPLMTLSRRLTGHSPFLVTELELLAAEIGATVSDITSQAERQRDEENVQASA